VKAKNLPGPPYNPGIRDLVHEKRASSRSLKNEDVKSGFKGWHERGYLPHRDEPGLVQFVTFRLADAFPKELRAEWAALLQIEDERERQAGLESYLDKGEGECYLRQRAVARLVENSLQFRHGLDYELRAWVIMPNHVHLLFKVLDVPMSQLVDAWKGFTAKQANKILRRHGQFWQEDYWDTFVRDDEHERQTRKYIEANPVKAGLVTDRKEWLWSSARWRDSYERLCLPG
jgi:REP element-mobilizing transposase RayT